MDILRDSRLVIFSHSTNFITFSCKSLAGFLFKFLQSSRRRKPEMALDFCVSPLCAVEEARGVTRQRFIRGGSARRSNPLLSIYHFGQKECPFQIPSKMVPLKHAIDKTTSFLLQIFHFVALKIHDWDKPAIWCNRKLSYFIIKVSFPLISLDGIIDEVWEYSLQAYLCIWAIICRTYGIKLA